MTMTCYFCGTTVPNVDAAIDAGWVPSFWDGDIEIWTPVCAPCAAVHLRVAEHGEMELASTPAPDHIVTATWW